MQIVENSQMKEEPNAPSHQYQMISNHYLAKLTSEAHVDDLRRAAHRSGLRRAAEEASPRPVENLAVPITIRLARPPDASALATLAALDSARVLSPPVLIAEAAGEARAAVSLYDGAAIADPFKPTAGMLQLLHARAAQLRGHYPVQRRHLFRVLGRWRKRALAST
jgi:hypothetical protein